MSDLLNARARISVGGRFIWKSSESAKKYSTFISWWLALGKPCPESAREWSGISGPGVVRGRTELISEQDWASLEPDDAEALREWIEKIPCGILYD